MHKPAEPRINKSVDGIQQRLTSYAIGLSYDSLPAEVIHAAKVRVIDNLAVLFGGFFEEPCQIVRNLAALMPDSEGATVVGTRIRTTPDMAAFVNGTTARYVEMNDTYHWPGSYPGHPSDVVMPILAAAEHVQASGRDFITSVVLAYEVFCRICDIFDDRAFDNTNFACLSTAIGAGKLFCLSPEQLAHCIAMAVVPNNILRQVRQDHMSMFKPVASGQAGRAGVFSALLARAGMEGPHLPFEGKAGWCDHVARKRYSLDTLGGDGTPFKILDTRLKDRPSAGGAISSILAAEKVAPALTGIHDVKHVSVEVYKNVKLINGTGAHRWNPDSRENAETSVPYLVATTLMDGTVTLRSYSDAHLWNPQLRALMQKIEVVENEEFTQAYERLPVVERARVTVVTSAGERFVGVSGGDHADLSVPKDDAQIAQKFRALTEGMLGTKRTNAILDRLWHLEDLGNMAEIPPALILD